MRTRASILVGRDEELGALDRALRAARTGRGGAVFLVGEAGIGKSRLAGMAAHLGLAADMPVLRGRASAIGPAAPYRPLTEALLSLVRGGTHVDVAALGPYRPVLSRLVPDWGEPPSPADAGVSLVVLAEAVLRLTALVGRRRGCLVVLDDLQDTDAETLAVVDYLVDNLDRQPAVLLGTIRNQPCAALDLARAATQRGTGTLLELRRLDRSGLRRLVASCLGCGPSDVPGQLLDRLWTDSAGNPLLAEELLSGIVSGGALVRDADGWRVAGELRSSLPATLARSVARRVESVDRRARDLLLAAAMLGPRFPLTVVQAITGLGDRELVGYLHGDVAAQLIAPDDETPDWYAFQHPLIAEALLSTLAPAERVELAERVADELERLYPGLPGDWCQLAATLRQHAGDTEAAGRLLTEAGARALAAGAAASAVTLLDRACSLLDGGGEGGGAPEARAAALETLLYALAEAGLVERVLACVPALDRVGSRLDRRRRARLHTRLAWAMTAGGRSADGLAQVEIARSLLGPDAADEDSAPVDIVAAHLLLDRPGPDRLLTAETMARRAAAVAEALPLPVVACQAWQLLGAITRSRDLAEATACLERARQLAVRHQLPIWEIHALVRLGNDEAMRTGDCYHLEQARSTAARVGAVVAGYQAESSVALQQVLRGEYAAADALVAQVLAATTRLKLMETTQYTLLVRVTLAAHRGRRRDMERALAEFREWSGDEQYHAPRVHGLARAFCALLEEDRPRATRELAEAFDAERRHPSVFQLSGRYGLRLLLRALSGDADADEYRAVSAAPTSQLRWNRQFALLAGAVLAGRAGRGEEAAAAVAEAARVAQPYAMSRHLGLRLVGEAALVDGWGTPLEWLRAAEDYFHEADAPAVAGACRALLRRAGAPTGQRRTGSAGIPRPLRSAGVTVREYEVLRLLAGRLGNREIADRLHLSPRTVEKHVASLLAKTGQPDRIGLGEFAASL